MPHNWRIRWFQELPPIPTRMLLSPVDLLPYLSAALAVLGTARAWEAAHV